MIKVSRLLGASRFNSPEEAAKYMVPFWTAGCCWHYAWALHELKGGKIYVCRAYYLPDPSDPEDEAFVDNHAMVSFDGGNTLRDFKGVHSKQDIISKYDFYNIANITRKVIKHENDNDFKDMYLGTDQSDKEILDIARWVIIHS